MPDSTDGVIERFDPDLHGSGLIAAEHLARYQAVCPIAPGKRVLDIAAGTGWGARMLLDAGAKEVVGVEIDSPTVDQANRRFGVPSKLTFEQGDLLRLGDHLGTFDLITCFETLEHVTETALALASLHTRLSSSGVLVCSVPNASQEFVPNPFHLVSFDQELFEKLVRAEFTQVAIFTQQRTLGSIIQSGSERAANATVADLTAEPAVAFLAVASDRTPLPGLTTSAALGVADDLRYWVEQGNSAASRAEEFRALEALHEHQESEIQDLTSTIQTLMREKTELSHELNAASAELRAVREEGIDAVSALADLDTQLAEQRRITSQVREAAQKDREAAQKDIETLQQTLSWRITAPLRRLRAAKWWPSR